MLSNAYFLAKFRFDIAEKEPAKVLQTFANVLTDLSLSVVSLPRDARNLAPGAGGMGNSESGLQAEEVLG